MEICRGCLSTELHVQTLDESVVDNLNLITNLNIKCTEGLSVLMCDECLASLNFCIEFRDKCIASDVTLKQILSIETKEEIKKEINDEFDDHILEYEPFDGDNINNAYCTLVQEDDQQKRKPRKSPRKPKTDKEIPKPKRIKTEDSHIFNCGLCTKIYDSKEYLIKHLEKVHKSSKVCSLCQLSCVGYSHLLAHRMEHLPHKQKGCLYCNNRHILTQATMEYHYMKVHDLGEKNEKILCKLCSNSYETAKKLRSHMSFVHKEFKFTCDICSKRFRSKKEVRYHLVYHNEEKQYKCDKCDYKSKNPGGLRSHITRRHLKDKAVCKPCGRVFQSKELMEEHKMKCKHAVKLIICPVCGLTVKRLKDHLESHSDVHKYKCEKCPATYKTKGAYNVHMNKHDGIKKQQCQHCSRRFYARSALLKHLRTQTGEKPYVCKICSKGFTGNHNLKVHMKVHGINNLIVKRNKDKEEAIKIFSK